MGLIQISVGYYDNSFIKNEVDSEVVKGRQDNKLCDSSKAMNLIQDPDSETKGKGLLRTLLKITVLACSRVCQENV